MTETIDLTLDDLRAVTAFAVAQALEALPLFEANTPGDDRPRRAIEAAAEFAAGGKRSKAIRDGAWGAMRAAAEAGSAAAREAANAAMAAAGAAYLHPLPKSTQVRHILGSAAHAASAAELAASDDASVGQAHIAAAILAANAAVVAVLKRYPEAPTGGGRTGALLRELDTALRACPAS